MKLIFGGREIQRKAYSQVVENWSDLHPAIFVLV
jgi:hypothetical protein